jgi:hypothetical protein
VDFFPFLEEFASKAQMNIQFLEDYNVPKKHNHPYRDISMNLHLDTLDLSDSVSFLSASLSRKSRDRTSDPAAGFLYRHQISNSTTIFPQNTAHITSPWRSQQHHKQNTSVSLQYIICQIDNTISSNEWSRSSEPRDLRTRLLILHGSISGHLLRHHAGKVNSVSSVFRLLTQ